MTEQKTVAKRENTKPMASAEGESQTVQAPQTETIFVPAVDIREDADSIRLEADMPGVDQDSVDVSVENGVLIIEGRGRIDAPEGCELVGQEYGLGRYRRDFELSDQVDPDGIKARMRDGVLEVTLPKHEKAKTKKIKIEA